MAPTNFRRNRPPSIGARRAAAIALVVAGSLAASLAGCARGVNPYEITGAVPDDYRTNHPILIEEQVAAIDIPVSANTAALTPAVRSNIKGFAQTFVNSGSAIIAVVAPSGSPNQVAAAAAAVEVEQVLRAAGVNPRSIDYRVYRAGSDEAIAPIRIAYAKIDAHTHPCGLWNDQMTSNTQNRHYGSFGCATQKNLAAMVNNPLDLLYPRGLTPADAARRSQVLDQYRQGATTTSTNSLAGGAVAQGVGQ